MGVLTRLPRLRSGQVPPWPDEKPWAQKRASRTEHVCDSTSYERIARMDDRGRGAAGSSSCGIARFGHHAPFFSEYAGLAAKENAHRSSSTENASAFMAASMQAV